jgi:hypothetical protein
VVLRRWERVVLDPGHVGERHGGVELDVGAADPPTLPELPAVGSISSRHGMGRATSRSNPVVEERGAVPSESTAGPLLPL